MKKTLIILFNLIVCLSFGQGSVGINISNPDQSAALDIGLNNKGLLLPRVALVNVTNTTTPVNAPAAGLFVVNTNPTVIGGNGIGPYYFDGIQWVKFKDSSSLDNAYDKGGPGNGRIINADAGAFKIIGTDALIVSGTHAMGATINSEITGAGTRMFYSPNKSAFRAGRVTANQFDQNRVGNFSGAFGFDNAIYGGRNFGMGYNNITSNVNASVFGTGNNIFDNAAVAFGNGNRSGGNNSLSTGNENASTGFHSFSSGFENRTNTLSEIAIGQYSRNKAKTVDTGTGASFDQNIDSASTFYSTDAIFSIGNGTSTVTRNDAILITKSGTITINEEYNLPLVDGQVDQVMYTDGAGNLAWRDKVLNGNLTQIPLYADNNVFTFNNTGANINLGNINAALLPTEFNATGNLRVKVFIKYSAQSGTQNIRLVDHNGNVVIGSAQFTTLNPTNGTSGMIVTGWSGYNGTTPTSLHLNGSNSAGGSMTIENVYILVKSQ